MKILTGKVISKAMDKTAKVEVARVVTHPVYKKRTRTFKKYLVHDEKGVKVGDIVNFVACKPYSKMKKWKIVDNTENNKGKVQKSAKK